MSQITPLYSTVLPTNCNIHLKVGGVLSWSKKYQNGHMGPIFSQLQPQTWKNWFDPLQTSKYRYNCHIFLKAWKMSVLVCLLLLCCAKRTRFSAAARAPSSPRATSRFSLASSTASSGPPTYGSSIRRPSGSQEVVRWVDLKMLRQGKGKSPTE